MGKTQLPKFEPQLLPVEAPQWVCAHTSKLKPGVLGSLREGSVESGVTLASEKPFLKNPQVHCQSLEEGRNPTTGMDTCLERCRPGSASFDSCLRNFRMAVAWSLPKMPASCHVYSCAFFWGQVVTCHLLIGRPRTRMCRPRTPPCCTVGNNSRSSLFWGMSAGPRTLTETSETWKPCQGKDEMAPASYRFFLSRGQPLPGLGSEHATTRS